jgi:hypothetical protein
MIVCAVGGGWSGTVDVIGDLPTSQGVSEQAFSTADNPTGNASVVAISLAEEPGTVLVVAPAGAVSVQAVHNGRELASAEVTVDVAVLRVPAQPDAVVEAVNAAGDVVGAGAFTHQRRTPLHAAPVLEVVAGRCRRAVRDHSASSLVWIRGCLLGGRRRPGSRRGVAGHG